MLEAFSRTAMIYGEENMRKLKDSTVAVIGIGGVGSYVVEGLIRAGVGRLVICDYDHICETNINRQIHATYDTIGMLKVKAMKDRIIKINPDVEVLLYPYVYNKETESEILNGKIDYVVDAIDQVTAKIQLVLYCKEKNIPIIASMGTGNKVDPTKLEVADIYNTSICPLARVMRKELRKREVDSLKVIYSKEKPIVPIVSNISETIKDGKWKNTPGSVSFVPSVAGLIIVSEVIKELLEERCV